MAVTGAIFNSLIFGGVNSADYGIYITGEAVYNAPERSVEMAAIPGRNGAFALDQGRFENVEVKYPAGCFGDDSTDFRERIANFRNALRAQIGYQRLTDTYNPNEYRMGIFAAALEVSPFRQVAGEFDIVFNCKPQRFLASGETPITVESGDTITNPTMFGARPQLQVKGYGNLYINDSIITLNDTVLGSVEVSDKAIVQLGGTTYRELTIPIRGELLNSGDTVAVLSVGETFEFTLEGGATVAGTQTGGEVYISTESTQNKVTAELIWNTFTFTYGTMMSPRRTWAKVNVTVGGSTSLAVEVDRTFIYSGGDTLKVQIEETTTTDFMSEFWVGQLTGYSTKSALGDPTYIDLDIGEAWQQDAGVPVSLNNAVVLPANLPELDPGENEITFNGTITELKVVPNWWII